MRIMLITLLTLVMVLMGLMTMMLGRRHQLQRRCRRRGRGIDRALGVAILLVIVDIVVVMKSLLP